MKQIKEIVNVNMIFFCFNILYTRDVLIFKISAKLKEIDGLNFYEILIRISFLGEESQLPNCKSGLRV